MVLAPIGTTVKQGTVEVVVEAAYLKNGEPCYEVMCIRPDGQVFFSSRYGNEWLRWKVND
jgi:hypothetical protein